MSAVGDARKRLTAASALTESVRAVRILAGQFRQRGLTEAAEITEQYADALLSVDPTSAT